MSLILFLKHIFGVTKISWHKVFKHFTKIISLSMKNCQLYKVF